MKGAHSISAELRLPISQLTHDSRYTPFYGIKSRTVPVSLVPHVHKHVYKREYTYILNMYQHVNSREYTYRDHITNISVIKNHHRSRRTSRTAFGHSKMPKTPMVRSYNQTQHTCHRNTTMRGQRRQKTRKTKKSTWTTFESGRVWSYRKYAMLPTTFPDGERSQWKPPSAHPYDRPRQWMSDTYS